MPPDRNVDGERSRRRAATDRVRVSLEGGADRPGAREERSPRLHLHPARPAGSPAAVRARWDRRVLAEMRDSNATRLREFRDAGMRGPDFVWAATGPVLEA